jgi:hypothetical protein
MSELADLVMRDYLSQRRKGAVILSDSEESEKTLRKSARNKNSRKGAKRLNQRLKDSSAVTLRFFKLNLRQYILTFNC